MERRNPYSTPEGYIDNLKIKILSTTAPLPQNDPSQANEQYQALDEESNVSWGEAWRRLIGFAAGFALLVGFGWAVLYFTTDNEALSSKTADQSIIDTNRLLWVMSEEDVLEIVDHKKNQQTILAKAAVDYISFYGEADDVNLLYYD